MSESIDNQDQVVMSEAVTENINGIDNNIESTSNGHHTPNANENMEIKSEVVENSDHNIKCNENSMYNEISLNRQTSQKMFPEPAGNIVLNKNMDLTERMQNFKSWGLNTLMKTKQKVKEKLNRTTRTVDVNLEDKIDLIKVQKSQYGMMVANNLRTIEQLKQLILVHQYAARMNSDVAQTERSLNEAFLSQAQLEMTTVSVIKDLICKLVISNETLETLVNKTFDDIMTTIQTYENARVEFDAYKTETVRLVSQIQQKKDSGSADQVRLQEMQESLEQRRVRYESNKSDVLVKIELLEDHKNRVIQRELQNIRNAWCSYYIQCSNLCTEFKSELPQSDSKPEMKYEKETPETE